MQVCARQGRFQQLSHASLRVWQDTAGLTPLSLGSYLMVSRFPAVHDPPTFAQIDLFGESTSGNLQVVESFRKAGVVNVLRLNKLNDIYDVPLDKLRSATKVRQLVHSTPAGWVQQGRTRLATWLNP